MERETIIYNGKKYHRYPESPRRQLRLYFWRHDKWKEPPFSLHRQIWIDNYGEIPEGHVIHHKDENTLNNSIDNLECLAKGKHMSNHMLTEERRAFSKENGKKQAERLVRQLKEWRENNPKKAHEVAIANGKREANRAGNVLKKWREEHPEEFDKMVRDNGRKSSIKRWGENRKSI